MGVQDVTLGLDQTLVFDKILTNIGGFYHATTGIFTAPQDGIYVFHVSLMTLPGKDMYLYINKDGQNIDDVYSDGRNDISTESVSETWILSLEEGSEVWIAAFRPGDVHGWCHSQFSGFLLHSTYV